MPSGRQMNQLAYTIVIATRNRPAALRLSIPRMLAQSRPPAQLIVVDSSDDHAATVRAVKESVADHSVALTILQSERGLTLQRNASLARIKHPVVFFPDDDSIWFPGTAEIQMDAYERDEENKIAAIGAAESPTPPPDWEIARADRTYQVRLSQRFHQKFAKYRTQFEDEFFTDPFGLLGKKDWPDTGNVPDWFRTNDIVFVPYITGFRMSFRTETIRVLGFDHALSGYSLCEDIDVSFGAWRKGWVVAARNARVYHYRSPERRENGYRYGVIQILNRAYIVAKHSLPGDVARSALMKFLRYKCFLYWLGRKDNFSKARFNGARRCLPSAERLQQAPREKAEEIYVEELQRVLVEHD
jgi:glycosyltransferase involved in cell wall biosynthesis